MAFTDELRARVARGFASPNRFKIIITLHNPQFLSNQLIENAGRSRDTIEPWINGLDPRRMEELAFNCDTSQLHGSGIASIEQRYIGAVRKMPYARFFTDITFTFYCTKDQREYKFFHAWHDLIYPTDTNQVEYYENFIGDIKVIQLDKSDKEVMETSITEAWPLSIAPVELNYADVNVVQKLTVTFAWK